MATPEPRYRDLNLSFIAHPVTGDLAALNDVDAVKRAVRNLVLTDNYEIPFMPDKGCGVRGNLFENITPVTAYKIKTDIQDVIRIYEPRADLLDVTVEAIPDENRIKVTIMFQALNLLEPVSIEVFLEKTR